MSSSKQVSDVSSHQGRINMATMAQKVAGIIIRAGYRSYGSGKLYTDTTYQQNIQAAAAAGIPVGVYWYTTSISTEEAEEEADYLIQLLKQKTLDFPVFLDLEFAPKQAGRADQLSKAARTRYALAFLQRMEAAGYPCGVYCNADFWRNSLENEKLRTYARWIARYGPSSDVSCDLWQYTSTAPGDSYGVSSEGIDLSHCYTDFPAGAVSRFSEEKTESKPEVTYDMNLLRKGDRGQQVRVLQILLDDGLDVDGIFGSRTEAAVKKYQKAHKLDADGLVGPKTWDTLLA